MQDYRELISEILVPEETLQDRIAELGQEISQDYDSDKNYWVALYNPSETETAYVTVEWEFFEDIAVEIVEDAVSDACCGLTMGVGVIASIGVLSAIVIVKRRK